MERNSSEKIRRDEPRSSEAGNSYLMLAAMTVLSFVSMYVLMYAMVDTLGHVYNSVNQVYMAGPMTAPMVIFELGLMRSMYSRQQLNVLLMIMAVLALAVFWTLIRQQTAIGDSQFLRSMIPHHSGAILMCERAALREEQIKELCTQIIASQREKIAQMEAMLADRSSSAVTVSEMRSYTP